MCEWPEQGGEDSFLASFIKSQGHPINGEHAHNQPVAVTWDGNLYVLGFFPVIFRFIGFPTLLWLNGSFHQCMWVCKLLHITHDCCRRQLPSSPKGQTKAQFRSQTGTTAAHGREMLKLHTIQTLIICKIDRKLQPITVNSTLSQPKTLMCFSLLTCFTNALFC